MSYDGKIMRQALARFEEDKQRRAAEFTRRRDRLYETEPRLKEIEQQLRATMPKLIASALRPGRPIRCLPCGCCRTKIWICSASGCSC